MVYGSLITEKGTWPQLITYCAPLMVKKIILEGAQRSGLPCAHILAPCRPWREIPSENYSLFSAEREMTATLSVSHCLAAAHVRKEGGKEGRRLAVRRREALYLSLG